MFTTSHSKKVTPWGEQISLHRHRCWAIAIDYYGLLLSDSQLQQVSADSELCSWEIRAKYNFRKSNPGKTNSYP